MRLADELSKKGYEIELHEADDRLGGCWRVDWLDGYYREHAPKVMTEKYYKTMKLLQSLGAETEEIYGGRLSVLWMFGKFFLKSMTTYDMTRFTTAMYTFSVKDKRTVEEWLQDGGISEEGCKAVRKLCLALASSSKRVSAYCFFDALYKGQNTKFVQVVKHDLWIQEWERLLNQRINVEIFKNSKLEKLEMENGEIVGAKTSRINCDGDIFVCAMPVYALRKVLEKCDPSIQNNWMDYEKFKKYSIKATYSGFGFQLHFSQPMKIPETWGEQHHMEWDMEVISLKSYADKVSEHSEITDVWSCVIIDTDAKSSVLGKSANEIEDSDEVVEEALRQMSLSLNTILWPTEATISKGVFYNKKIKMWDMDQAAFNASPEGVMYAKGGIKNLYSVGPHNIYEIAALETALESADRAYQEIYN